MRLARWTAYLENLEMSGILLKIREMLGKWHGKFLLCKSCGKRLLLTPHIDYRATANPIDYTLTTKPNHNHNPNPKRGISVV